MNELTSHKMRKLAPELDPLRLGTGWKLEDLSNELILNDDLSQTGDVDNLIDDMDSLINSVKDYDE